MPEKINPFKQGDNENTQKRNKNIAFYDKVDTEIAEKCRCTMITACNYTEINKDENVITKIKIKNLKNFSFGYLTNGNVCTIFSHA